MPIVTTAPNDVNYPKTFWEGRADLTEKIVAEFIALLLNCENFAELKMQIPGLLDEIVNAEEEINQEFPQ